MIARVFKPFYALGALVLAVSLACSLGGSPSATQPPATEEVRVVETEEPTEPAKPAEPTDAPVATEEQKPADTGAASSLDDVEKAVVRIEMEGTYIDPEVGLLVNVGAWGTGFIIDPSGIAVTNNHVVTGSALLRVFVAGEDKPRNAKVLGVSECSDLAVIDIDGDDFPYLQWYDDPIKAGLDVYAAGYPDSATGAEYTLTKGIVSKPKTALDSVWASVDQVIEHSAKINPGNSGGPLVDENGKVLGVNYAGVSSTDQNYAISSDGADSIVEQLRDSKDSDTIGVNGIAVTGELNGEQLSGVWVRSVDSGSPADKARVQAGDILYQMEGEVLATDGSMKDYCDILRSHNSDDTLSLTVIRFGTGEVLEGQLNGRELETSFTFGTGTSDPGSGANPNASNPGDIYYSTEFDSSLDDWKYFLMSGEDDGFTAETTDSRLRFDITDTNTWVYFFYDALEMGDVRVDTTAENLGRNNNNVSLYCRYSDKGWYEFNIANNGTYTILRYDGSSNNYIQLFSGGSNLIKMGKDVNEYTAICDGDELTLGINGVEVRTVKDRTLKTGKAGLSVSSFNVTPITVEFDYFILSVP